MTGEIVIHCIDGMNMEITHQDISVILFIATQLANTGDDKPHERTSGQHSSRSDSIV